MNCAMTSTPIFDGMCFNEKLPSLRDQNGSEIYVKLIFSMPSSLFFCQVFKIGTMKPSMLSCPIVTCHLINNKSFARP